MSSSASLHPPSALFPVSTPMLPGLQPHVLCLHPHVLSASHGPRLHPQVPRLQSRVCSPAWLPSLGTLSPYLRASVTLLLVFLFSLPLALEPVALLSPRSSNAHRHLVAARRSAQAPPRPFLTRGLSRTRRLGACASRGPEGVAGKPSA